MPQLKSDNRKRQPKPEATGTLPVEMMPLAAVYWAADQSGATTLGGGCETKPTDIVRLASVKLHPPPFETLHGSRLPISNDSK
jgi:hypothetical protein